MLRSLGPAASHLLPPEPAAIDEVRAAVATDPDWITAAIELLAGGWRDQVTAAAAIAITGVTSALHESQRHEASSHEASSHETSPHEASSREESSREASSNEPPWREALWRAIDGASWVAPQLVAAALLADPGFERRAADRLSAAGRRPPKTIGALIRAYHRCPARRMPVVAQLGRHDRTMINEEARIGVRGVDAWADYFASISRPS